ncbi:MAG: hypothetical protein K8R59_10535, partial [Thermoanaerobaculales bacterium]|nr:hypothetical protein [Thermoanaerobaculales bacterium]
MRHLVAAGRVLCVLSEVCLLVALTACGDGPADLCMMDGGSWNVATQTCIGREIPKSAAASAGDALFVTAAAHVPGAAGTNWRTDLQVHNLADEAAAVRVTLLEHGEDNSAADYADLNLAPGASLRLGDVLAGEFGVDEGVAALILRPNSGRIVVTSRTYNLLGAGNPLALPAGSTFGQFIPAQSVTEAIRFGEQGRL